MDPKLSFVLIFCFFFKFGGATLSDANTNLNLILLDTLSTSQVTIQKKFFPLNPQVFSLNLFYFNLKLRKNLDVVSFSLQSR